MFDKLEMTPEERRAATLLAILLIGFVAVLFIATAASIWWRRIPVWMTLCHVLGSYIGGCVVIGIPLAWYKIHLLGFEISCRYGKEPYAMVLTASLCLWAVIVLICGNVLGPEASKGHLAIAYLGGCVTGAIVAFLLARSTFPILGSKYK